MSSKPVDIAVSVPPTLPPTDKALASVIDALFAAPVVVKVTAPMKSFAGFVSVMLFAPALMLEVVPTLSAPLCVTAPPLVVLSALATLVAPKSVVVPLVVVRVVPVDPATLTDPAVPVTEPEPAAVIVAPALFAAVTTIFPLSVDATIPVAFLPAVTRISLPLLLNP